MKFRILLLAVALFLAPAAAQAQRLVYVPYRAGAWGGPWGGGYWGGGYWGGGAWGRGVYSPYSFSGWGYSPFNAGWRTPYYNPGSSNPGYSMPTYTDQYSSGPIVSGFSAIEVPRMRPCLYPAVAAPSRETIRAALER